MDNNKKERLKNIINTKIGFYKQKKVLYNSYDRTDKELEIINRYDSESENSVADLSDDPEAYRLKKFKKEIVNLFAKTNLRVQTNNIKFQETAMEDHEAKKNNAKEESEDIQSQRDLLTIEVNDFEEVEPVADNNMDSGKNNCYNNISKINKVVEFTQSVNKNALSVKENFKNLKFTEKENKKRSINIKNIPAKNIKENQQFKSKASDVNVQKNHIRNESENFSIMDDAYEKGEYLINENFSNFTITTNDLNAHFNNFKNLNLNEDEKNNFFNFDFINSIILISNEIRKCNNGQNNDNSSLINFNCNNQKNNDAQDLELNIHFNSIKVMLVEKLDECINFQNLDKYLESFFSLFFLNEIEELQPIQAPFLDIFLSRNFLNNLEFITKLFYFILIKFNNIYIEDIYFENNNPTLSQNIDKKIDDPNGNYNLNNNSKQNRKEAVELTKKEKKLFGVNLFKIFSIISKINIYLIEKYCEIKLDTVNIKDDAYRKDVREINFNLVNFFTDYCIIENKILIKAHDILTDNQFINHNAIEHIKGNSNSKLKITDVDKAQNNENSSIYNIYFLDYCRKLEVVKQLVEYLNLTDQNENNSNYEKIYNNTFDNKIKKIFTHFIADSFSIYQNLNVNIEELTVKPDILQNKTYKNKIYASLISSKISLLYRVYKKNILLENSNCCSILKISFVNKTEKIDFNNSISNHNNNFTCSYNESISLIELKRYMQLNLSEMKDLFNLCFIFLKMKFLSNHFLKIIDILCSVVENNIEFLEKVLDNMVNIFNEFLLDKNLNKEEKNILNLINSKNVSLLNSYFGVYMTFDGTSISIYTLIFLKIFSMILQQNENWNMLINQNIDNDLDFAGKSDSEVTDQINSDIEVGIGNQRKTININIDNKRNKPQSEKLKNFFEKSIEVFIFKIIESNNQNLYLVFYLLCQQINALKYSPDFSISIQILIKFFVYFANLCKSNYIDSNSKKFFLGLLEILIIEFLQDFEELKNSSLCLDNKCKNQNIKESNNVQFNKKDCQCFNCLLVHIKAKKISLYCKNCSIQTNLVLQIVEKEDENIKEICGFCKLNKFLEEIDFPIFEVDSNINHKILTENIMKKKLVQRIKKPKNFKQRKNAKMDFSSEEELENSSDILSNSSDGNSSDEEDSNNNVKHEKQNLRQKFIQYQESLYTYGALFLKLNFLNILQIISHNPILEKNVNISFEIFSKLLIFENKNISFLEIKNIMDKENLQEKNVHTLKMLKEEAVIYQTNLKSYFDKVLTFYNKNKHRILNRIPDFTIENSTLKVFYFYFFYVNLLYAGHIKIMDIIFNDSYQWGIRHKSLKILDLFFNFEKSENIFNEIRIENLASLLKDNSFHIRDSSLNMLSSLFAHKKISKASFLNILHENINETSFIIRKKIILILINLLTNKSLLDSEQENFYFNNIQLLFLNKINDATESIKIKKLIYKFYCDAFSSLNFSKESNSRIDKRRSFSSSQKYSSKSTLKAKIFPLRILDYFIELLREFSMNNQQIRLDNLDNNSGILTFTMASNSFASVFIYYERIKLVFKSFYLDFDDKLKKESTTELILEYLFDEFIDSYNETDAMDIINNPKALEERKQKLNVNIENMISALNLIKMISTYISIKNYIYFESLLAISLENFEDLNHENIIKQLICQIITNLLRYADYKAKTIITLKDSLMDLILKKQVPIMLPALETYFVCLSKNIITIDQIQNLAEKTYKFIKNYLNKEIEIFNWIQTPDNNNARNNTSSFNNKELMDSLNVENVKYIVSIVSKSLNLLYYIIYLSTDHYLLKIFEFLITDENKTLEDKHKIELIRDNLFRSIINFINFYASDHISQISSNFNLSSKTNITNIYTKKKILLFKAFGALSFLWIRFPIIIPSEDSKIIIKNIFPNLKKTEDKFITIRILTNIFFEIKTRITISQNYKIKENNMNNSNNLNTLGETNKKKKKNDKDNNNRNKSKENSNLKDKKSKDIKKGNSADICSYDPLTENIDLNFDYGVIHLFFESFISEISNFIIKEESLLIRSNAINLLKLILEQGNINIYAITPAIFSSLFDYCKEIRNTSALILEKSIKNSKDKFFSKMKESLEMSFNFQKSLYVIPTYFNSFVKDYRVIENSEEKNNKNIRNKSNNNIDNNTAVSLRNRRSTIWETNEKEKEKSYNLEFINTNENIFELLLYKINKTAKTGNFNFKFIDKIYESFKDIKDLDQKIYENENIKINKDRSLKENGSEINFGKILINTEEYNFNDVLSLVNKFEFFEFIAKLLADFKFTKTSEICFILRNLLSQYDLDIQCFKTRFNEFKKSNFITKENKTDNSNNINNKHDRNLSKSQNKKRYKNAASEEVSNKTETYIVNSCRSDDNISETSLFTFDLKFLTAIFILLLKTALVQFLLSKYEYIEKNDDFFNKQIKNYIINRYSNNPEDVYSHEDIDDFYNNIAISKEFKNFKFYEFYSGFINLYQEILNILSINCLSKENKIQLNKFNKRKPREEREKILRNLLDVLVNIKNFYKMKRSEIKLSLDKNKKKMNPTSLFEAFFKIKNIRIIFNDNDRASEKEKIITETHNNFSSEDEKNFKKHEKNKLHNNRPKINVKLKENIVRVENNKKMKNIKINNKKNKENRQDSDDDDDDDEIYFRSGFRQTFLEKNNRIKNRKTAINIHSRRDDLSDEEFFKSGLVKRQSYRDNLK